MRIALDAEHDLRRHREYIARDKPRAAREWESDARRLIRSLAFMPLRFELVPEEIGDEYRHALFGNYRIIFRVTADTVLVLRIVRAEQLLTARLLGIRED